MMKLKQALILTALIFSGPIGAHASTIDFGVITGDPGNKSRSWQNTVDGQFTDYALFSTTKTANFSASITNSYGDAQQFINGLTLVLYKGSVIGSGTQVATMTSGDANASIGTQGVDLTALRQLAGSYYLSISGTNSSSTSYGGSLAISVVPVPLPATAPLFGAAVLALGVAGYGFKRKQSAATA